MMKMPKTVDAYITNDKMRHLSEIVYEKANAYKNSTKKLEELCNSQPLFAVNGLQSGALLIKAISVVTNNKNNSKLPMEAILAAKDYMSMREALDDFMREGKVPGGVAMELSRRVLDADI